MRRFSLITIMTIAALGFVSGLHGQENVGTPSQARPRLYRYTLDMDDHVRTALVYLPPQYGPDRTLPVVLVFHPNGADSMLMAEITQMHALGDQAGFITVYPDAGLLSGRTSGRSWPVGSPLSEEPLDTDPEIREDVAFTVTLLNDLALEYSIDDRRIYAAGLGQGASMAARLACDLADRLAAAALVSPGPPLVGCRPSSPVSVLVIQDSKSSRRALPTADEQAPSPGRADSMVDWWLRVNRCAPDAAATLKADDAQCWTFRGCPQTGAVDYCQVKDAGQGWPGAGEPLADTPYADLPFSASYVIWRFFDLHGKPLSMDAPALNPPQSHGENQQTEKIEE